MATKIKKIKCGSHENERDISEYYLAYTVIHTVEHYECKRCKYDLDEQMEREEKCRIHNEKQQQEAWKRYNERQEEYFKKRNRSIKEDIWDYVVKDELCKGLKLSGYLKYQYKENIPKEVLQLKRASMKLERLINEIKKGERSKIKTPKEFKSIEMERLKGPLVNCPEHGQLYLADVVRAGKSRWSGRIAYKCKICLKTMQKKHYLENKDNILLKHKEYRVNNPEKIKQIRKNYKEKINGENKQHATIEGKSAGSYG